MSLTLMQRVKALMDQGRSVEEVAQELMVSVHWVRMLMSADSFVLVRGENESN